MTVNHSHRLTWWGCQILDLRARILRSRLTWWDSYAAVTSRGKRPILANGPKMKTSRSTNILLKNKCVTSAINSQPPLGFWKKYEYQYKLRCRYKSEEEEYEHRTGRTLGRRQAIHNHWHCPFFRYCWNSGMS